MENYNNLPVVFEEMGNILDDRFIKVKVWIAHTGENRNSSIFSKEVLESMIPSLANVPILGYLATNKEGIEDFHGHEQRLVIENGEFSFKYVGRAWGMIPEANNAHFELRYGEDGVEREYLVCEGVLWRKFPEVEEIFDRDSGFKNQSMELHPPSVQGYVDEKGLFVFTQAKFEGACILGENVTPAMISSTIEKFSVANNIKSEFSEMITEFNIHFSKAQEKGDDQVEIENQPVLEPETPENFEETPEVAVTPEVAEVPVVEPETEFTEPEASETPESPELPAEPETDFADKKDKKDDEDKDDSKDEKSEDESKDDSKENPFPPKEDEEEDDEKEDKKKKFTLTFELSHDDVRTGLYNALRQHESFKDSYVWVSKVYDSHAVIEDEDNGKFFKVNYVKHEGAVSVGEHEEIFPMFVNSSEKQAIDIARTAFPHYEVLENEVKELREFKSNAEMSEKEGKLTSYASVLSKEEYQTIKDNLANFSMVDIEKEIGYMLLKKNNFSATEQEEPSSRVGVVPAEENFRYGALSKYFQK